MTKVKIKQYLRKNYSLLAYTLKVYVRSGDFPEELENGYHQKMNTFQDIDAAVDAALGQSQPTLYLYC